MLFISRAHFFSWLYPMVLLCFIAFMAKWVLFLGYIQFDQRYRQADSMDYHICALSIKHLHAMIYPTTREPIFWRTPGYPYFLSFFYDKNTARNPQFEQCTEIHKQAIFWQIILCSLLPLVVFLLAYILTHRQSIAWIASCIIALHLGFNLASCYLLTDALASLFFLAFLIFVYLIIASSGKKNLQTFFFICLAAGNLALYTWMRPHGEFIALATTPLLFLYASSWRHAFIRSIVFLGLFFALLSPWYIRNYQLTGHHFFCPMSGPYLQAFCAPKIMRAVLAKPLDECIKLLSIKTVQELRDQKSIADALGSKKILPKELVCLRIASPWVQSYPFHFIYYWIQEVIKTTLDLFSYQLVALHQKTHFYDPLEEFLSEKLFACLYKSSTPGWIKMIAWLELIFYAILWFGFFAQLFLVIRELYSTRTYTHHRITFITMYMILIMIGMTGGFGYARLRLIAEPLIIITSLQYWYGIYRRWYKGIQEDEKIVCSVAH